MKIRDDLPATKFTEPLYRSAICVDTSVVARGRRAALLFHDVPRTEMIKESLNWLDKYLGSVK